MYVFQGGKKRALWDEDGQTTLYGHGWEKAMGFFFPAVGTVMNSYRIDKVVLALGKVANDTAATDQELLNAMVELRTMVMQNRVALDMLLAEKGGVCGVIEDK